MLEKPISAQGNISDRDNLFFLLILYSDNKKVRQCSDKPGSVAVSSQEETVLCHLSR